MADTYDLQAEYNRRAFVDFLRLQFLPEDFEPEEEELYPEIELNYFERIHRLGQCPEMGLNVYEILHESEHDPRVSLTKEIFRLMNKFGDLNALVVFVSKHSVNYRLSYINMGLKMKGKKIIQEGSNPRRYSFLLGPDSKVKTPYETLIKRNRVTDMEDLGNRFSIEVVNRDFYNGVSNLFTQLVGGSRRVRNQVEEHHRMLLLPSQTEERVFKDFAVRLLGRVIFCWFLKKKKVDTSDYKGSLIPDEILSLDAVKANANYYHEVLEKLFFMVLNTPHDDRLMEFLADLPFKNIPFLNGGLFEPHGEDFYQLSQATGLSENISTVKVPDEWLKDLFELLETYNFTIDENTSMDVELSVDPEMLGRIFENLLAELNPETGETARKATGSYYTPRPIVEFMVDESLKEYFRTKTDIPEERLECLLSFSSEFENPTDDEREAINRAVDELKVIDPACGSGAFPMGVLQKLVLVLQKVDPDSQWWLERCLRGIDNAMARNMVREQLKKENVTYIHKLELIRTAIYGVDIQQVAVEISKLRVFLSLIVDTLVDPHHSDGNMGVKELPNLEFKFVCADTLKVLEDYESKNKSSGLFEAHDLIKHLKTLRGDYFSSFGPKKTEIKERFQSIQRQMFEHMQQHRDLSKKKKSKETQTEVLTAWDPFSYKKSDWFDPDWMFGVKSGFDIVISNPPYVRQEMLGDDKGYYKEHYNDVFHGVADIYVYFIRHGMGILKPNGVYCIIVANKWMRANYGTPLRKYLKKKRLVKLIDFGDLPVFQNATTYPCILLAANSDRPDSFFAADVSELKLQHLDDQLKSIQFSMKPKYLNDEGWNLANEQIYYALDKIKKTGIPLENYVEGNINRGITTGLNKAFVIDEITRSRLIEKDVRSVELIKPFLTGREVKQYCRLKNENYLIFTRQGVEIKRYPAILEYLQTFKDELMPKSKDYKGKDWGGRKSGPYKWFEIQDVTKYYLEFEKPKIMFPDISLHGNFAFDDNNSYCGNTAYIIGSAEFYLLGLLNSTLMNFYYRNTFSVYRGGYLRFIYQSVAQIPIKQVDDKVKEVFECFVDYVMFSKKHDLKLYAAFFEQLIDALVFELYFGKEIEAAGKEIFKHLGTLTPFTAGMSDEEKQTLLESEYNRLRDPQHPVHNNMETLDNIDEIRIVKKALQ